MPSEQVIEWVLKAILGLISVFVFLLGRDLKRSDEQMKERAVALQELLEDKALAFDRLIDERFDARDQQIAALGARLTDAGKRASDAADKVMEKINPLTLDVAVMKADTSELHKRHHTLSNLVMGLVAKVERLEHPRA